jgi:15-cis-phytoene synthase
MDRSALVPELPPPYRLALAYAPRRAQLETLALLALDQRLGGIARAAREPLIAQMKLAWWRDRLGSPSAEWPAGEPLLAVLTSWGGTAGELVGLVDGWEAILLEAGPAELAAGRARACAELARVLGLTAAVDAAQLAGRRWTEAEFGLAQDRGLIMPGLPRQLRALAILPGLLAESGQSKLRQFLAALRIGLFGR